MNDAIREKIIKAARKLFMNHGYRSTTIDDISQTLGISKRTIYENFSNKREIVEEVVNRDLKLFSERVHQIVVSEQEPLEKFRELYRYSLRIVNMGLSQTALKDLKNYLPDLWEQVLKVQEEVLTELGNVIEDGKEKGLFKRGINTEVTVAAIVGALQTTLTSDFLSNHKMTLDDVFSGLYHLFTKGLEVHGAVEKQR